MSLVARHLEARGIPTLCITSARDIIESGRPPRAVYVDYPLGHTTGKPFDPADQIEIVRAALQAWPRFERAAQIINLDRRWAENDDWKSDAMRADAGDTRALRDEMPQYQLEADRLLAEARAAAE